MSDEPTSRRVTRSSRRITNEGEQGPTSQQADKAAVVPAQVLNLTKRGKAGRGGRGSHGGTQAGRGGSRAGGHKGGRSSQSSLVSFKLIWDYHIYRFSSRRH